MTTLNRGSSVTLVCGTGGTVTVTTTGGYASVLVAPAYGVSDVFTIGPAATVRRFGPFSLSSTVTITNQSAALDYVNVDGQGFFTAAQRTALAAAPVTGMVFAAKASQSSYGPLVDQSAAGNVFLTNAGLFPPALIVSTHYALGAYVSPIAANGILYKCTTAGDSDVTEATWGTTIAGTTTQGTAVFTAQKGPYFVDAAGTKLFRSIASSQTGQQSVHKLTSATQWNLANGDSFILNMIPKFDWNGSGQAAAVPIFSTSTAGTGPGFRVRATGGSLQDARLEFIGATSGDVLSGNMSPGYPFRPFDGVERVMTIMVDGPSKTCYMMMHGITVKQTDMTSGSDLLPNGMSLASVVGSTAGGVPTIGGDPGSSTSYECAFRSVEYTVLQAQSLPANIQAIGQFYAAGGERLLPQSMVL